MLILSRRSGESIIVDNDVTLTVLSIKGKQVRIGIDAPEEIAVHREEIYERAKQKEAVAESGQENSSGALTDQGSMDGNTPEPEAVDTHSAANDDGESVQSRSDTRTATET